MSWRVELVGQRQGGSLGCMMLVYEQFTKSRMRLTFHVRYIRYIYVRGSGRSWSLIPFFPHQNLTLMSMKAVVHEGFSNLTLKFEI